jgi:hypothetical protein
VQGLGCEGHGCGVVGVGGRRTTRDVTGLVDGWMRLGERDLLRFDVGPEMVGKVGLGWRCARSGSWEDLDVGTTGAMWARELVGGRFGTRGSTCTESRGSA